METRIIKKIFNKNGRRYRDVKAQKVCEQGQKVLLSNGVIPDPNVLKIIFLFSLIANNWYCITQSRVQCSTTHPRIIEHDTLMLYHLVFIVTDYQGVTDHEDYGIVQQRKWMADYIL